MPKDVDISDLLNSTPTQKDVDISDLLETGSPKKKVETSTEASESHGKGNTLKSDGFRQVGSPTNKPTTPTEVEPEKFNEKAISKSEIIQRTIGIPPMSRPEIGKNKPEIEHSNKILADVDQEYFEKGWTTPDRKIRAAEEVKADLKSKYDPLFKNATTKVEADNLKQEYAKDLEKKMVDAGFDKNVKDGIVSYKLPQNEIDHYKERLRYTQEASPFKGDRPNNTWAKSAYYNLVLGSGEVMDDINSLLFANPASRWLSEHIDHEDPAEIIAYQKQEEAELAKNAQWREDDVVEALNKGNVMEAIGSSALGIIHSLPAMASYALPETKFSKALALGEGIKVYNSFDNTGASTFAKGLDATAQTLSNYLLWTVPGKTALSNIATLGKEKAEKDLGNLLYRSVALTSKSAGDVLESYSYGAGAKLLSNIGEYAVNPDKDLTEGVNDAGLNFAVMMKAMKLPGEIGAASKIASDAMRKTPSNLDVGSKAHAQLLMVDKLGLQGNNELMDKAFHHMNNDKVEHIDQVLNVVSQPPLVKEKLNLLNQNISKELNSKYPDVNKIGKLEAEIESIENGIKLKSAKEIDPLDKQIDALKKEKNALYDSDVTGTDLQKKAKQEEAINKKILNLHREKMSIKQKIYDDALPDINSPLSEDLNISEKSQAHKELKKEIPSIENNEQLKREKNEEPIAQTGTGKKSTGSDADNTEVTNKEEHPTTKGVSEETPKLTPEEREDILTNHPEKDNFIDRLSKSKASDSEKIELLDQYEKDNKISTKYQEKLNDLRSDLAKRLEKPKEPEETKDENVDEVLKGHIPEDEPEKLSLAEKMEDGTYQMLPENKEDFETSLKRAVSDAEKSDRQGSEKLAQMENALQSTDIHEVYKNTKDQVDKGVINPKEVAKRILRDKTGSLEDESALLYERGRLKNQELDLKKSIKKESDPKNIKELTDQLDKVYSDMDDNDIAAATIGREASSIFRLRQEFIKSDYSLTSMKNSYMEAKGLKELSPEQEAEVKDHYNKLQDALTKIKELEDNEKLLKENNDILKRAIDASKSQKKADREAKTANIIEKSNHRISKAKDRIRELLLERKGQASSGAPLNIDVELAGQIAKIASEKVLQGAVTLADIVSQTLDEIKEHFPEWDEKDVLKYLGKHNLETKKKEISEESKILSQAKKIANIKARLEDEDFAPKTKSEKVLSDNLKKLVDEYDNLKKQFDTKRKEALGIKNMSPEESRLKAKMKQIDKIKARLDAKDYSTTPRKEYEPNIQLEHAKSEYENLKDKWEMERRKDAYSKLPGWQKGFDRALKMRTGWMLLSGVKTLGKLVSFTAMEAIIREPVNIISSGLYKLIPGTVKPKIGGLDFEGEKQFYKTLTTPQIYKDALTYLTNNPRTHELYGRLSKKHFADEFSLNLGRLHGVEKYPLWKATFDKTATTLLKHYAETGQDITDPGVKKIIDAQAAEVANKRIMMNQNWMTKLFSKLQMSAKKDVLPAYYLMKFLFPIVTVPTNMTIKTARGLYGVGEFAGRLAIGFNKMTPEQSDKALAAFKDGLPGLAIGIMALSTNWLTVDDKKKLIIGGWKVPDWMQPILHHPDVAVIMMYAEAKNEFNNKVPKYITDPEEQADYRMKHNLTNAVGSVALNTLHETPFFNNMTTDLLDSPDKLENYLSNTASSLFVPQLARDIASMTDPSKESRTPTDLKERFEVGIPGLRENVPTKSEAKDKKYAEKFELTNDPKNVFNETTLTDYAKLSHKLAQVDSKIVKLISESAKEGASEKIIEKNITDPDELKDYKFNRENRSELEKLHESVLFIKNISKEKQEKYAPAIEKAMIKVKEAYSQSDDKHSKTIELNLPESLLSKIQDTKEEISDVKGEYKEE
jgi:hypothetical protein